VRASREFLGLRFDRYHFSTASHTDRRKTHTRNNCRFYYVWGNPITGPWAREVLRRGGWGRVPAKGWGNRTLHNANLRLALIAVKNGLEVRESGDWCVQGVGGSFDSGHDQFQRLEVVPKEAQVPGQQSLCLGERVAAHPPTPKCGVTPNDARGSYGIKRPGTRAHEGIGEGEVAVLAV
jgi:hypothetical protein